jgi:AAA ATPase domain
VIRALSLMRTRGVGGLARAFVGRDAELDRLNRAYRRGVERRQPLLVTILGDAGVGKTRLMRELWERLGGAVPEPARLTGRCLAYGEGITFWPLAEILKEHLEILESDPPDEVRRRLGSRQILGLTLGLDVAGDLHPLAARDRLQAAWVDFVSELAAERPIVLLVEDVHWAEQPLIDLLERLARDVRGPLLLLVTARPDFARAWDPRLDADTVLLEPLGENDAASLVDALLGADLPGDVRELVVRRAEGNPFFVEEVLGSLIDAAILTRGDRGWQARDLPQGFELPDSVQAVLAARIDLLDEPEKAALQAAAVIGRVFWTGPVYELVAGHEPELGVLESRDLIRRRSVSSLESEVEYVFKHALTREVAYAGLTKARRARLHASFGDWIERVGAGRDEHAPLLAHHYAEAARPEDADVAWPGQEAELERLRAKALTWLVRAGEAALSRYELDDARTLFERALVLEREPAAEARLWRRIGRTHALAYDGESFMPAMQRALELAPDERRRAETYAELAFEGAIRSGMWRRRPTRELMDEWTTNALAGVRHGSEEHVKALLSRAFWGLPGEAEAARLASQLADELSSAELRSAAWDARGVAAFREGDFEGAHTWEVRRFDIQPEITNPDLIHDMYMSTIPITVAVGRMREARRLATELGEFVGPLTPHHRMHGISCRLEVEELAGEWDAIVALERQTEEAVADNSETPCVRNARSLLLCAVARELTGDRARAQALEAQAAELEAEGVYAIMATPRARLALWRGDVDRLAELITGDEWLQRQTWFSLPTASTRLDALAVIGSPAEVADAAERLGRPGSYLEPFALRAVGIARQDDKLLARAHESFRALRLDWYAAQTDSYIRLRKAAS